MKALSTMRRPHFSINVKTMVCLQLYFSVKQVGILIAQIYVFVTDPATTQKMNKNRSQSKLSTMIGRSIGRYIDISRISEFLLDIEN